MRIATWNVERGGRSQAARHPQEETLQALAADVVVLTEPPATYKSGPGIVASPAERLGSRGRESWVAIVGRGVESVPIDVPYERMAAAARVAHGGRSLIIYGSVLPWLSVRSHAPELVRDGEEFSVVFDRLLGEQKADLTGLRTTGELVVWSGDFNQSVTGPNRGGSRKGRDALQKCLTELGFVAWNADADHAREGLKAIDLICGPQDETVLAQGRIDPVRGGVTMSDHAGYWIEL